MTLNCPNMTLTILNMTLTCPNITDVKKSCWDMIKITIRNKAKSSYTVHHNKGNIEHNKKS